MKFLLSLCSFLLVELLVDATYSKESYDKGGYDKGGYDKGGYDKGGYDKGGYDKGGYDKGGYNIWSYDKGGYDKGWYDKGGYEKGGYDKGNIIYKPVPPPVIKPPIPIKPPIDIKKDFCSIDCTSLGVSKDGNWATSISKLNLQFIFVKDYSSLGIININLKIVVVLIKGYFGIFDLDGGFGLIINASNNMAMFVTGISDSLGHCKGSGDDLIKGIGMLAAVIIKNQVNLSTSISGLAFNIANNVGQSINFVSTLAMNAFALKAGLSITMMGNFVKFMTLMTQFTLNGVFNAQWGAMNLILGFVSISNVVFAESFIDYANLFIKSSWISSSTAFSLLYNLQYFVESFLDQTIQSAKLVNLCWNFSGYKQFSVTSDSLVIVDSAIVGPLQNFASYGLGVKYGSSGSVQGSSSFSANINFSVQ